MPAFRYVAVDPAGRQHRGTLEGDSARLIRQDLRDKGLMPVKVDAVRVDAPGLASGLRLGGGPSSKDLQLFTQQLATLLRSGLPLEEALQAIARQAESAALEDMVLDLRSQILEGKSLTEAMNRHTGVFNHLYRATVGAGEASGRLEAVLGGLVTYIARQQRLARKTKAALVYPVILTVVSILVVIGLLRFVVPEIVVVFQGTGQDLPTLTVGLIALSDFLGAYWPWLLGGLIGAIVAARVALARPGPRAAWHRFLISIPGVAKFLRTSQTARLTRTLAILVGSGVPLLDSLRIAIEVLNLVPYREALAEATDRVREGEPLNKALEHSRRIPPITLSLIASGEAAGNLAEMLDNAAEDQEAEIEASTEMLLSLFEPILILVMGSTVLLIVLAMLLPIFEMNQLVG